MKRLSAMVVMVVMAMGWCAPGLAQVIAYRDTDQNLYFEGLPANELLEVRYIPDPNRPDRRYKSAWMYKKTDLSCSVHHLWHSSKLPILFDLVVFGTQVGDVTIPPGSQVPVAPSNTPCDGNQINPALPWTEIVPGSGIKAVRADDPCRFSYIDRYTQTPACRPASVMYIAELPSPTYRVASSSAEIRFIKSSGCGFLKLANTQKWKAYPKDRFQLRTNYKMNHSSYQDFGQFNRGNLAYRTFAQIPKCFDGKRYMYQP